MSEFKYDDFIAYEKKNYAKLEFLALEQDIAPLINKGVSVKAVYGYFKDKGRLTMCYQSFARYMRKKYGSTRQYIDSPPSSAPTAAASTKSFVALALANWKHRERLEDSVLFKNYSKSLAVSLVALKEVGKSGNIDRIIAAESTLVSLERELHQEKDSSVMSSLNAAVEDFSVMHKNWVIVRDIDGYKTKAAASYHTKNKVSGVVADGFHEAINGHITRLGNQMKAVGISVPEKNVIRQRQENMRMAKKLYMDLQRHALGLPAPEKSKGREL